MLDTLTDPNLTKTVRENPNTSVVLFKDQSDFEHVLEEVEYKLSDPDLSFFVADPDQCKDTVIDFNITTFPSLVLIHEGMVQSVLEGEQTNSEIRLWIRENS